MKIIVKGYTYETGPHTVKVGDTVILHTPDWLRDVKGPTWEGKVEQIGSTYTGYCSQIAGVKGGTP